jgi:hypothetical protein
MAYRLGPVKQSSSTGAPKSLEELASDVSQRIEFFFHTYHWMEWQSKKVMGK